ncbi:hypothetical protein BDM02DRAFT_874158 [Thelephora ganbajun]|uniref:Uncharacterized protein n=1 Tax=Thelephora ganbajun TaxID=370292 RepID=A0ACB6Z5C5_THEGA|nr:hypothetical protein BDM02DRAFT_874158 [Thelephora ganbajun]
MTTPTLYPPFLFDSQPALYPPSSFDPQFDWTHDAYSQPGVDAQWTAGHHPSAGSHQSPSWPPQQIGHSDPPMFLHGSTSVIQIPDDNTGRRQVIVPQRPYVLPYGQSYFDKFIPENPITFPSRSGGDGIVLTDAINENFDHLIGRDDHVFVEYTGSAITLRLEWPGYESWAGQIRTKDWRRKPEPVTRAKLATEVAKKVRSFIRDNIDKPTTSGSERWRVGPGFIEVKDLVLIRLLHVSKGSWQAEFRASE